MLSKKPESLSRLREEREAELAKIFEQYLALTTTNQASKLEPKDINLKS